MADDIDNLPDLDPELRALVSAYEAATARDAAQVDAALARVTANAGTAGSGGAAALSTTTKIWIVGALAGVVAVVGVVALGPSSERASARTQSASTASEATAPPVADETPRSVGVDAAPVVEREESAVEDAPERATNRRAKSRAPAPRTHPTDPPPAESSDSLKAELELLRQARSALRRGRAEQTLEIVRQHRRDYPSSAIAEERDATEVSALCALGRLDEGACR